MPAWHNHAMSQHTSQRRVSQVVRTLLTAHGQTQEDLADVLELTQSAISNKINGKVRWSVEDVWALAVHFDRDPGEFFEDAKELIAPNHQLTRRLAPNNVPYQHLAVAA